MAVEVAPDVGRAIAAAQRQLQGAVPGADVRWADATGSHLTLAFLGEVPEARVPAIVAALEPVAARTPPLTLTAVGLGGFPDTRRPRVLWAGLGVAGAAALAELAAAVREALDPLGFPAEGRPFRGHVTVGRVRSPRGGPALATALAAAGAIPLGSWTATELVLFQSRLGRAGAVHTGLARLPLGGAHT